MRKFPMLGPLLGSLSVAMLVPGLVSCSPVAKPTDLETVQATVLCDGQVGPRRIMFLGDSYTSGLRPNGSDSFRPYLWQLLREKQADVDFVGTRTTPGASDQGWDGNHEGRPFFTVGPDNGKSRNVYRYISEFHELDGANNRWKQDWVTWARPDIITVLLGTNDQESDAEKAYRRLDDLVGLLLAKAPGAVIVLGGVPPNKLDEKRMRNGTDAARRVAESRKNARILFVDVGASMKAGNSDLGAAPFSPTDWASDTDHVHLSPSGGRKFSAALYPTLTDALALPRCP